MGKKSLIKSTSKKKKTTAKKKDEEKKTKPTKKKAAAGKTKPPKKTAKKKAPVKAKKKAAPKKKKVTLKELLSKKFEHEFAEKPVKFEPEAVEVSTAPPIIDTSDKKEQKRLKELLFKKFDLAAPEKPKKKEPASEPAAEKAKKAPHAEPDVKKEVEAKKEAAAKPEPEKAKPKVSLKELLSKKFEYESAEKPVKFEPEVAEVSTAPPIIDTSDKNEAKRLKELLFKKFDLAAPEKPEKKAPAPEPAAEKAKKAPHAEPDVKKEVEAKKEAAAKPEPEKAEKPTEKKVEKPADPKEIRSRIFMDPAEVQKTAVKMKSEKVEVPSAPPLVSAQDKQEANRLKSLLFRTFEIPPSPEPEEAAEDTAPSEPEKPDVAAQAAREAVETARKEKEEAPAKIEEKKQEEDKVSVSYDEPPPPPKGPKDTEVSDPMEKMIKIGAIVFALVILLLLGYSFANKQNYYVKTTDKGIEVWRGKFAPMGKEKIAALPGVAKPEPDKDVYSASEVLPLVFRHYIDQADLALDEGIPDFESIQNKLEKALSHATTPEERRFANARLSTLKALILDYKASALASRGTTEDVQKAIRLTNEAIRLDIDETQKQMLQARLASLQTLLSQIEAARADEQARKAAEEAQAAEEARAAEEAQVEAAEQAEQAEKTPEQEQPESQEQEAAEAPAKEAAH